MRQDAAHAFQLALFDPLEGFIDQFGPESLELRDERLCVLGHLKPPGPAVGGIRHALDDRLTWSVSAYHMTKQNDILAFQRLDDVRETVNAGETLHRGVEVGVGAALPLDLVLETAFSHARHTYEDWAPNETTDYSGNEMENAPLASVVAQAICCVLLQMKNQSTS